MPFIFGHTSRESSTPSPSVSLFPVTCITTDPPTLFPLASVIKTKALYVQGRVYTWSIFQPFDVLEPLAIVEVARVPSQKSQVYLSVPFPRAFVVKVTLPHTHGVFGAPIRESEG